jgi:hypothetical protein
MMDVVSHVKSAPAGINTSRWEWHPTVSGDWILFGRERLDRGRWRVFLHNTSTDQTIPLADVLGKPTQADPGQVSGDYAVWDRCAHHVCNVYRYQISTGQTTKIPNTLTGQIQHYPSVTSTGVVYFAHSGDGCVRNVKLVEWIEGQPLNVLVEFAPGRDVTSTTQTVPDQVSGTDVYFDKYTCHGWPATSTRSSSRSRSLWNSDRESRGGRSDLAAVTARRATAYASSAVACERSVPAEHRPGFPITAASETPRRRSPACGRASRQGVEPVAHPGRAVAAGHTSTEAHRRIRQPAGSVGRGGPAARPP